VNGVLNIDKPAGLTSHDVVAQIRRITGIRRVGHAGTLDPLATGVLLLCLGQATRLVEYLVGRPKSYETTIRLGQSTTTYDAEGSVVEERPVAVTAEQLERALAHFRGSIKQQPPLYSAIKQGGQPLYKLARRNAEDAALLPRPWRMVTIYALEVLAFTPPTVQLRLVCSSGTYVRSLAHDLGQQLGCGGHVSALRRLAVGDFTIETAVPLARLGTATWQDYRLPADAAVAHLPLLVVTAAERVALQQGQRLPQQPGQPAAELVRAYDATGVFIGVVAAAEGMWRPRKIISSPEA
jgi:tRNA pseudouridine55 synthase